jgi:hypothetical protein
LAGAQVRVIPLGGVRDVVLSSTPLRNGRLLQDAITLVGATIYTVQLQVRAASACS